MGLDCAIHSPDMVGEDEAGVADAGADPGPLQEHDGGAVDQPARGGLLLHPHNLARALHPTALPQLDYSGSITHNRINEALTCFSTLHFSGISH